MLKLRLLSAVEALKKMRPVQYFVFGALSIILIEAVLLLAPVTKSQAANLGNQYYTCGKYLHVVLSPSYEPGTCGSTGYDRSITSYSSSMTVKADTNYQNYGAYTVVWGVASYWCSTENPHAPCLSNFYDNGGFHRSGLTGDNKAFATLTGGTGSSGQFSGQACGYYQNDFGFYIYDNSDSKHTPLCGATWLSNTSRTTDDLINNLGTTANGDDNNNASWCHTNTTCTAPTPTPTVTPTPTSVPTATPTPTNVPSATPTPTASPTPTGVPSATPTLTATPTVTPTVTPTATPTETLTPTVTPTGTLTPTATPTETLTPTVTPTGTLTPTSTITPTATLTPTGTITPAPSATPTPLPPAPLTQTPSTGPEALVWILELVGALPLGLFLRKNTKLK